MVNRELFRHPSKDKMIIGNKYGWTWMLISQGNRRGIAPTQYREKRRAYAIRPYRMTYDFSCTPLPDLPFENFRAATEAVPRHNTGKKMGVCNTPLRDGCLRIRAVYLCLLSPSKIVGLRPRLRVKNFRLFEPKASS